MEKAIILTAGLLTGSNAKTAHGLIRSSGRWKIAGVIDQAATGPHLSSSSSNSLTDAGVLLDGIHRDIPIYPDLQTFLSNDTAQYAIVGVAFAGGKIPAAILTQIREAITAGLSIISGAHEFLSDMPDIRQLAGQKGVTLLDIRKPRPKDQLAFWSGAISEVKAPVIAVLGTDCALGKRTTAVMITAAMKQQGTKAEMVYTGQTGWLQGHKHGFVLDSTYNDFISGELERAVVECYKEEHPDVIFVEGQSALCNPSGPCGSELLLSARCKGVILQHAPAREFYKGQEHLGARISLQRELDLINLYGAKVLAITLNTSKLTIEEARDWQKRLEAAHGLPVILPLEDGMQRLSGIVSDYITNFKTTT